MQTLNARLSQGKLDESLAAVYGKAGLERAKARCAGVLAGFESCFGLPAQGLFSAPGRTELGGNHTDHQRGRVLAAAVDLDILAAAAPNHSGVIRVQSQGYPLIAVDLERLEPVPGEENTSAALIRGVAARMVRLGCPLKGAGLDAWVVSDVPGGSGLSSSAAFEVLVGTMFNELFWGGTCSAAELARIGQYAENVYFGKPCGLMDQTACAVGGVVAIDFADPERPSVESIGQDLAGQGYALCILNCGADHADLTAEYAAIPGELQAVCRCFDREYLRQVPEEDFWAGLPRVRREAGDRAALRAMHVYEENRRVLEQGQALKAGDFGRFLELVDRSGGSSAMYLQNLVPAGQTGRQELLLTVALCRRILGGRGAARVHGGGFGGTAQAFVPLDMLDEFLTRTQAVLGEGCCQVLNIRPVGGVRLA